METEKELSDLEIVRLIAYVHQSPITDEEYEDIFSDDPIEEDNETEEDLSFSDEYLIDFLTVEEAKKIGSDGILTKIASTLVNKNIINFNNVNVQKFTWRLIRNGDLTPSELKEKESGNKSSYKVKDLRHLH